MYRARNGKIYSHKETPEEYLSRRTYYDLKIFFGIILLLVIGAAILEYLLPFIITAVGIGVILIFLWFFRGFLFDLIRKTFLILKNLMQRK